MASVSSDPSQIAERRRTGSILSSPFEAHARSVIGEPGSSSSDNSNTVTGEGAQHEGGFSQVVVQRKQSATSQPNKGGPSGWQSLLNSSSSPAEQPLNTAEAVESSLPEKRKEDDPAGSVGGSHRDSPNCAGNATRVSTRGEMEMISLTSGKHHDESDQTHEEQNFPEGHTGSVLAGQTRRSLPRRTPSEASLARPKFNLMVYAGWVPPSLRTSPIGGWIDNRLTDGHMGSCEVSGADRSGIHGLSLSSKPLLPLPWDVTHNH